LLPFWLLFAGETVGVAQEKAADTAATACDKTVATAEQAKQATAPYVDGAKQVAGDTAASAQGTAEVSDDQVKWVMGHTCLSLAPLLEFGTFGG
jgi:hypothetical protein